MCKKGPYTKRVPHKDFLYAANPADNFRHQAVPNVYEEAIGSI